MIGASRHKQQTCTEVGIKRQKYHRHNEKKNAKNAIENVDLGTSTTEGPYPADQDQKNTANIRARQNYP